VFKTIFVFAVLTVGWGYALQSPLYCEMLWHYFALTIALERVAVAEMAVAKAKAAEAVAAPPVSTPEREPEFAWG
jgi:hypothetical protein